MLVAWLLRTREIPAATLLTVAGLAIFIAAIVAAGLRGDISYSTELLAGAGATLLVLGTARLEERGSIAIPKALQFAGDASYSIYLIHYPFFMFFAPFVYRAWLRHPVPLAIPFVVMSVCAVAAGCGLHVMVERPLLKLFTRPKARSAPSATDIRAAG